MLKKCEILSICRKIRLFEDDFYFSLALSLYFLLVFPLAFLWKRKQKNKSHAVTHSSWLNEKRVPFLFLFSIFLFFVQDSFFCPFGMIEGVPEHGKI